MSNSKKILKSLNHCINILCQNPSEHLVNPQRDFSRQRKISLEDVIRSVLSMQNKALSNELLEYFNFGSTVPTASAFIQQRAKIKVSAFEQILKSFTAANDKKLKTYRGYRLLAVDGSDIAIAPNPEDYDTFFVSGNNAKPYSLVHLNAMYDLVNHIYTDIIIQKRRSENEVRALADMVDRCSIKDPFIIIADRGYESYNDFAHIQEKGQYFLFRMRDCKRGGIVSGLNLPDGEFDITLTIKLTRKQTNKDKELIKSDPTFKFLPPHVVFDYLPVKNRKSIEIKPYELKIRIVRFKLTDNSYEVIATNLDEKEFPPCELKTLYAMRWGIETSFRDLKYTVGLVNFHSKKVEFVYQEIFARIIMYNFCELITSHVVIQNKSRKYYYKINFSKAVHICRNLFLDKLSPHNAETLIARFVTPIRPDRKYPRRLTTKAAVSFTYRIA